MGANHSYRINLLSSLDRIITTFVNRFVQYQQVLNGHSWLNIVNSGENKSTSRHKDSEAVTNILANFVRSTKQKYLLSIDAVSPKDYGLEIKPSLWILNDKASQT